MTLGSVLLAATPLDEFLGGADTHDAERIRDIGAGVGTAGLLVALGVVVYLTIVHRGTRREIRALVLVAGLGGVALLAGATAELAGIQAVFETGWRDVLSVDASSAAMMRALAGVLVVFGLAEGVDGVADRTDAPMDAPIDDPTGAEASQRWTAGADSSFGLVGLAIGVLSFSFDGHTVTEGPRVAHLAANAVHVTAGAVWFGGIVALLVVAALRHRTGPSIAGLVLRFSSVATVAILCVAVAGAAMTLLIIDDVDDLTDSVWGRRLIVKLVAVGIALVIGAYHHFVTVPRLAAPGGATLLELARARTTLAVEALVLAFVVVAAALLVNGAI